MELTKWDKRWLQEAKERASWSKDPSSQIGSIIVLDKLEISSGYNGFPRNIKDTEDRLNERETKYKYVCHAEVNAIYNAARVGRATMGCVMYVYGLPVCHECAKAIIQAGIWKVIAWSEKDSLRWLDSSDFAIELFKEAGVQYNFYQGSL